MRWDGKGWGGDWMGWGWEWDVMMGPRCYGCSMVTLHDDVTYTSE